MRSEPTQTQAAPRYDLGLVLEGGAIRGIYTAGVLDVLMAHGLQADMVIGTSAGCIHGCNFVSGQAGRSIRYYRKYRRNRHFMGLYALLTTGEAVGRKFCYEEIPTRLDPFDEAAFEASPVDFYVTVTNVRTGRAEHILCPDLRQGGGMEVLRAGASMPLCSRITMIGGQPYLDGGVADSVPYRAAKALGCRRCLVVLTQPAGYLKHSSASQPMFAAAYRRYPAFVETMARRAETYNAQVCEVEQAAKSGETFLIRPSRDTGITRMERDMQTIDAQYALGRADTEAAWPALARWLKATG